MSVTADRITYTVVPRLYVDWLRRRQNQAQYAGHQNVYWDCVNQLASNADWGWMKHEFVVVDFDEEGLAVAAAVNDRTIRKHLPITALIALPPLNSEIPYEPSPINYCHIPFKVGDVVECLGTLAIVTEVVRDRNTWRYKLQGKNEFEFRWSGETYPHNICDPVKCKTL